tara:strand:+ start:797 stop:1228 length:432 start_codon:yes stop_codon:yes gene_type:complete
MFELQQRKKVTEDLLLFLVNLLKNLSTSNKINGLYVFIFHWLVLGVPLVKIIFGKVDIWFVISCFIWIIIFIFHIYFNGCILTRLERKLWDTKNWYGPWCLPFTFIEMYSDKKISREVANNIFYCWAVFLIFYVSLKLIYYKN